MLLLHLVTLLHLFSVCQAFHTQLIEYNIYCTRPFVKYAEDLRLTVKGLAVTCHLRYEGCRGVALLVLNRDT